MNEGQRWWFGLVCWFIGWLVLAQFVVNPAVSKWPWLAVWYRWETLAVIGLLLMLRSVVLVAAATLAAWQRQDEQPK